MSTARLAFAVRETYTPGMDESGDFPQASSHWPEFLLRSGCFRWFDCGRAWFRDLAERRRFAARRLPERAARVLVVRDRGLGDVLQITTILPAIRTRYRVERLDFLTCRAAQEILARDPAVDRVLLSLPAPQLSPDDYDLVLNLHIFDNSSSARAGVAQFPADKVLGMRYLPGEEWLSYPAGSCWLRKYCRIADVPFSPDLPLRIKINRDAAWETDRAALAARLLPQAERDPAVAVCLGGMDWHRNYSVTYLVKILQRLSSYYLPVLVGLRSDRPESEIRELDELLPQCPKVVDLTDKLDMRQLLLTLDSCQALVTCDTGPIHLAIGLGTPLVALFGHTTGKQLLGPELRGLRHAVLNPVSGCRFCGYRTVRVCREARRAFCVDRIPVDDIYTELARLVGKNGK